MMLENKITIKTRVIYNKDSGILGHNGKPIEIETQFNPEGNVRIHAEVMSVPPKVDYEVTVENPGYPMPQQYIPGMFFDRYERSPELLKKIGSRYRPGVWEPVSAKVTKPEVQAGDVVYFHFHSLIGDENFLFEEDGWKVFVVDYAQIFCVCRKVFQVDVNKVKAAGIDPNKFIADYRKTGEFKWNKPSAPPVKGIRKDIKPISGYVLCEPYFPGSIEIEIPEVPKGFTPLPKTIRGNKTESGLVSEVFEEPSHIEAVVCHVGEHIGFSEINVKPGDRILFTKDSDFVNRIEGKDYYVMRQWDIFALNNDNITIPLGFWIEIEPIVEKKYSIDLLKEEPILKAKVVTVGNNATSVKPGMVVQYISACFKHKVGEKLYIEEHSCLRDVSNELSL